MGDVDRYAAYQQSASSRPKMILLTVSCNLEDKNLDTDRLAHSTLVHAFHRASISMISSSIPSGVALSLAEKRPWFCVT